MPDDKMRIAYLSNACIPSRTANSIHVMKMCQAFARNGHEVVLFVPDMAEGRESGVDDPFIYYGIERSFRIRRLPWIRMTGRGYIYGWQAARQVRLGRFDLAFGRNLASCCFAAQMGMQVIYEAHTPVEYDGLLARCLFGRLIHAPTFKYLVVVTHALRRHIQRTWPELAERIVVAPDGADPLAEGIEPVSLSGSGGRLQVGYTGHLYPGKGAELVVELAHACPQFDFHIVGGTNSDLRRWHERNDRPANLHFHGHQPHSQLPRYLMAFDVVLLPNQPKVLAHGGTRDIGQWTSPLKLFEYMAAGRAIICSDVPVLMEVADDRVNMLICRHDEIDDWAAALGRLEADPDLRWSLGITAQRQFETRYTWEQRARRVLGKEGCLLEA